jgi:CheY-specific phosphatase CheX
VSGSVFVYLANAGVSVDVTIENLTTGESTGDTVSGSGIAAIPISSTSGNCVITFVLLNGDEYEGEFNL